MKRNLLAPSCPSTQVPGRSPSGQPEPPPLRAGHILPGGRAAWAQQLHAPHCSCQPTAASQQPRCGAHSEPCAKGCAVKCSAVAEWSCHRAAPACLELVACEQHMLAALCPCIVACAGLRRAIGLPFRSPALASNLHAMACPLSLPVHVCISIAHLLFTLVHCIPVPQAHHIVNHRRRTKEKEQRIRKN